MKPAYLAVNYEDDIFCFSGRYAYSNIIKTPGQLIANWFKIPDKHAAHQMEASEDETRQRIFSARRLAFDPFPASRSPFIPEFTDFDFEILKKFKRLKEIIIVALYVREIPHPNTAEHGIIGGPYAILSELTDGESARIHQGLGRKVKIRYALDPDRGEDPNNTRHLRNVSGRTFWGREEEEDMQI
ncbi:hypothetical protein NPX13_g2606 [Xylaria arbuscula]|uniref:Uncharacterized protein n=1 Tax=Xylaria arbuscula TaxID=114810 RepID=A0A9W8TQ69_9PEZI|nr:hypothetical protein NPX13_g2606 [Xylaria arbuscula]